MKPQARPKEAGSYRVLRAEPFHEFGPDTALTKLLPVQDRARNSLIGRAGAIASAAAMIAWASMP